MSIEYSNYIHEHLKNVKKAYDWIDEHIPELLFNRFTIVDHDGSKLDEDEYDAYDEYFYGDEKTEQTISNFNYAWLTHIHRNPHHWQYWILVSDDPKKEEIILEMPYEYICEMICDWWTFSWKTNNLKEIFNWYEQRKDHIKLGRETRKIVEHILKKIKTKLEEKGENNV